MTDLLLLSFAVLWAWVFLLVLTPVRIPAVVQSLLVAGLAYGGFHISRELITAAAIAGLVAILHLLVRRLADDEGPMIGQLIGRRRPNRRVPDLP